MRRTPMRLGKEDRIQVEMFLGLGKANARTLKRALILLKSDAGWTDAQIAADLALSEQTVRNVRQRFRSGGIEAVLADKRPRRRQRLSSSSSTGSYQSPGKWLQEGLQRLRKSWP